MATDKKFGGTADWIKDGHAAAGHCSYCGNKATGVTVLAGSGKSRAFCKNCGDKPTQEQRFNSGADR